MAHLMGTHKILQFASNSPLPKNDNNKRERLGCISQNYFNETNIHSYKS